MINKSMLINKVIENIKNDYQLAVAQNNSANIKIHQTNLQSILLLKQQLEQSGELNESNVNTPHTPPNPPTHPNPPQPNKGGNK